MGEELTIQTNGEATVQRQADRATVLIKFTAQADSEREAVSQIQKPTDELQGLVRRKSASQDAPIVDWKMDDFTTTSKGQGVNVKYTTSTKFNLVFRDAAVLTTVVTKASKMAHATVTSTTWQLLDGTRAASEREARQTALQDAIDRAKDFADTATGSRRLHITNVKDMGPTYERNADSVAGTGEFQGFEVAVKDPLQPGHYRIMWKVNATFTAEGVII